MGAQSAGNAESGAIRTGCAKATAKAGITHQEEVVVLRLRTQILEDGLLPVSLHVVPIIDLAMSDRIVNAIAGRLCVR